MNNNKLTDKELAFLCLNEAAEILDEGACKTNKKHKLDNYLSRYNYKGDKKSGTIEVEAKTYHIDRDVKSPVIKSGGEYSPRYTGADTISDENGRQYIHLDKNFEKLKNNKRRDALLQHEIGHLKLHSVDPESKHLQSDRISKSTIRTMADEGYRNAKSQGYNVSKSETRKEARGNEVSGKYLKYANEQREKNKMDRSNKVQAERDKNIGKLKKYETDSVHTNTSEYEADRHASTRSGTNQLKRALRDGYKHANTEKSVRDTIKNTFNAQARNDGYDAKEAREEASDSMIYFDNKQLKNMKKNKNKVSSIDYNQRVKALKDKSVNDKVYRESIELLLNEANELLNE